MSALYAARSLAPVWFAHRALTPAGAGLLQELTEVERRGLIASDYEGARLAGLIRAASTQDAMSLARLDVALSVTAARLASDLHRGRVSPAAVGYDLDIANTSFDAASAVIALASSRNTAATLDGFEPQLRHYTLLKTELSRYIELARKHDATRLPPLPRKSVHPGEAYAGAAALRRLLFTLGDLPGTAASALSSDTVLDAELVTALQRFQSRHGLDTDGVLGRGTHRALTTPLSARIQQIVLSLERVRWLPARLDSPPIIVNIPQFRLFAFRTTQDAARDILQMNVIVGASFKARRTPVFAADMKYVVLQPYWDVPRSILIEELMPQIEADSEWLAANDYEIVQGPGDDATPLAATPDNIRRLAAGKLRLRQKPGSANALGHVKFMLPNKHNVYLHDTPARALFASSRRAFSHGCIRVSDPMALLAHVLRDQPEWNEARIAAALQSSSPTRIPLTRPVRVFILYGTAMTLESGATLFFEDIYEQDARLTKALQLRRATTARHES